MNDSTATAKRPARDFFQPLNKDARYNWRDIKFEDEHGNPIQSLTIDANTPIDKS